MHSHANVVDARARLPKLRGVSVLTAGSRSTHGFRSTSGLGRLLFLPTLPLPEPTRPVGYNKGAKDVIWWLCTIRARSVFASYVYLREGR